MVPWLLTCAVWRHTNGQSRGPKVGSVGVGDRFVFPPKEPPVEIGALQGGSGGRSHGFHSRLLKAPR